ncbi:MAG: reverse transcriptase domain-containing protein [Mucilaginibacter sp.]
MKRKGNLYDKIYTMDNLILADQMARRGKANQSGVKEFDRDPVGNLQKLHEAFKDRTYQTSAYSKRTIYEPKEREISILPYIDRVAQHAILLVIEPVFNAIFTADTYASIKGKGIHAASYTLRRDLRDIENTTYYLQMDIEKFYPSVDAEILKIKLRRIFKDQDLLKLLDGIVDSAPGLPIGNYLSQFLANYYLSGLDRMVKNLFKVKYYRYCDDLVVLGNNKSLLHHIAKVITAYCKEELNLTVKPKYIVAPVWTGINFVGYKHYPGYVLLRPTIKHRFARAVARRANHATISSYLGWAKHANCRHLIKKLLPNDNEKIQ